MPLDLEVSFEFAIQAPIVGEVHPSGKAVIRIEVLGDTLQVSVVEWNVRNWYGRVAKSLFYESILRQVNRQMALLSQQLTQRLREMLQSLPQEDSRIVKIEILGER